MNANSLAFGGIFHSIHTVSEKQYGVGGDGNGIQFDFMKGIFKM